MRIYCEIEEFYVKMKTFFVKVKKFSWKKHSAVWKFMDFSAIRNFSWNRFGREISDNSFEKHEIFREIDLLKLQEGWFHEIFQFCTVFELLESQCGIGTKIRSWFLRKIDIFFVKSTFSRKIFECGSNFFGLDFT